MITYDWDIDGLKIPSVYKANPESTEGIAFNIFKRELYFWEAQVTPRGYSVEVITPVTHRATKWEGPSFNMLLEVAVAVNRH